ncbi:MULTISPECIES: N-acetylneuraminate synthase family protein [unclassified Legionella]|uniref:N-acetylneuraminate synthase family protein n=1 Tax=unclassified Legionella TaxID=2622702 RepID=UPI0010550F70|nr:MULTISPECIES: N-acetylneuraminate synthase family protein [unclassified Legionella]MDI9817764.1 N-acetylneuraminate synthase family protein [Legionella sp. PL877]
MFQPFHLGPFLIDKTQPPVFLAEIGTFFNKDIELAKDLLQTIIKARDLVAHQPLICKTEILNNPDICLHGDYEEIYSSKTGEIKKENYRTLIERKILSLKEYELLFSLLREVNLPFIVSVYEFETADFAVQQGACALKTSSSNLVHIPLIRYLAKTGLPLIIDTGRSNLAEIFNAVDTARREGCEKIIIEHSPDGHPALPEAHNLKTLQTLKQCFNLPVGLSDHHNGIEMLFLSIGLGASVLEKGVHFFPESLDQDLSHTMDIDQLPKVLQSVHNCWLALGNNFRDLREPIRGVIGSSQRNCLIARHDLAVGETISLENIKFAFPCRGVAAQHWDLVQGWQVRRNIKAGRPIQWTDINKI